MDYVIGLGANLGSPRAQFARALDLLQTAGVRVVALSPLYDSEPVGPPQPRFLNGAVRVECALTPPRLLQVLHGIERELGRVRIERWGPRTLDLDILWCNTPWSSPELQIPHAHLRERWFALKPLLDVAPELASHYADDLTRLGETPVGRPFDGVQAETL